MVKKPFNKPPTKSDLREHIDRDVEAFLRAGGEINAIEQGETALEQRKGPLQAPLFTEPRAARTPVDDVVKALEERQKARRTSTSTRPKRSVRPRRKVIYDDFGEPLRTVWQDE